MKIVMTPAAAMPDGNTAPFGSEHLVSGGGRDVGAAAARGIALDPGRLMGAAR
jgi:hypothetical protein